MSFPSVSPTAPAAGTGALPGALSGAPTSADNEQRFLKLLVTQLNNQDPLNPMDNGQLTSQLAQMSTVSGIERMNGTLQSILQQGSAGQMLQAAGMVGRGVLSEGHRIVAGDAPATFAVDLPGAAASVQAVVTDDAGNTVRTIDIGPLSAGTHGLQWDGRDDAGHALPPGNYSVQVVAANGATPVGATTLVCDRVIGVTPGDAGAPTLTLASGASIQLADVRQVY